VTDDDRGVHGRDIELGFMVAHNNATELLVRLDRMTAHVNAVTELLIRDQVIDQPELEALRVELHEQMVAQVPRRVTARVAKASGDKYASSDTVILDCANRLPLCRAACCRLAFYLSDQDLEEGIVRWDFARPYRIKQDADGYCTHCKPDLRECGVWSQRPQPCRNYDCRSDQRIWVDYDARIPNPAIAASAPLSEQ